ncbi:MAG: SAM-dependent methyltransferase, partial [Nitrospirota bacterium]
MAMNKQRDRDRCDQVLAARGLVQSRDAAVRMILAGKVRSNGAIVDKPSRVIPVDAVIEMIGETQPFVSRGGEKLEAALDAYSIAPQGLICLDVGCSTGGFTDCLLKRGAAK